MKNEISITEIMFYQEFLFQQQVEIYIIEHNIYPMFGLEIQNSSYGSSCMTES